MWENESINRSLKAFQFQICRTSIIEFMVDYCFTGKIWFAVNFGIGELPLLEKYIGKKPKVGCTPRLWLMHLPS